MQGKRFGRLVVTGFKSRDAKNSYYWVLCDCGVKFAARDGHLRSGNIVSCGCYGREIHTKHGYVSTKRRPEYRAWDTATQLCTNPKVKSYAFYGGKGIEMRFPDFQSFINEVGERPSPEHRLIRLDKEGHYEPGNLAWKYHRTRRKKVQNVSNVQIAA